MSTLTIEAAQADMRRGYLCGAPGLFVSGLVWLTAAAVVVAGSPQTAVVTLLVGGVAIHPGSLLLTRMLGAPGRHTPGNALAGLAGESTGWLLAGCAIAYGMHELRIEWFFPTMLLVIGGRYLAFQTIYGLRLYWAVGLVLCLAGLTLAVMRAPVAAGAFTGAIVELVTAALLFPQAGARNH